eukprot:scaffold53771_cov17-Prasinocladus_malaysianus.AAC.1
MLGFERHGGLQTPMTEQYSSAMSSCSSTVTASMLLCATWVGSCPFAIQGGLLVDACCEALMPNQIGEQYCAIRRALGILI